MDDEELFSELEDVEIVQIVRRQGAGVHVDFQGLEIDEALVLLLRGLIQTIVDDILQIDEMDDEDIEPE